MEKFIDFNSYAIRPTLKRLLVDKTTKRNIIWATNTYHHYGSEFGAKKEISIDIFKTRFALEPRVLKCQHTQAERTKDKAEVFTPSWLVNEMINYCDEEWFGRKNVFNVEKEKAWGPVYKKIEFDKEDGWKDYVNSLRLEIACGEAPYLASRYDADSGEELSPTIIRIGMLDRKLRVVDENTEEKSEWIEWAVKAVQSCYGYEYQGDNLLIARINILMTFVDHYEERWNEEIEEKLLLKLANIISWNIWQMDGLTDTVPFGAPYEPVSQINFFDLIDDTEDEEKIDPVPCRIFDWRANKSLIFGDLKERTRMKKFDYIIGNPPYNKDDTYRSEQPPVYHKFYDEAIKISNCTILVTPGRFLYNAGKTPETWDNKMLNSEHFKVLDFIMNAENIFPTTQIRGGVAITMWKNSEIFEPIKIFYPNKVTESIMRKVLLENNKYFSDIIYSNTSYKYSKAFYDENPDFENRVSGGSKRYLTSTCFDKFPEAFVDLENKDKNGYTEIIGRQNNARVSLFVKSKYIRPPENFINYKLVLPSSNGSGNFGEKLSDPFVGEPCVGYTETFVTFGDFKTREEAENTLKYIKTKFARTMLSTKKVTPGNKSVTVWKNVPLQDFTNQSDIDWSKSIPEIDQQLYKKYGLSQEEIDFIEENVQEMV